MIIITIDDKYKFHNYIKTLLLKKLWYDYQIMLLWFNNNNNFVRFNYVNNN